MIFYITIGPLDLFLELVRDQEYRDGRVPLAGGIRFRGRSILEMSMFIPALLIYKVNARRRCAGCGGRGV